MTGRKTRTRKTYKRFIFDVFDYDVRARRKITTEDCAPHDDVGLDRSMTMDEMLLK